MNNNIVHRTAAGTAFTPVTLLAVILLAVILLAGCGSEERGIRGSGTIEATEITIAARTQGELTAVHVVEGQQVKEGAVLAKIDAEDLELQLEQKRQQLKQLEANLALLREGPQREDLQHARANLRQARHAMELARSSYDRMQRLREGGSATPSELDRAESEFEQASARLDSAEAQLKKLENKPRPQEVEAMEAQVAAARAGVRRMENRLEDAAVTAPRRGTVTTAAAEEGEYVAPGTPLFTIADLSEVYLTIYVPEPQLGHISLGQTARINVDGIPDTDFSGTVSRIAEEAEFTPKNVQTQDARAQLVYAVEITIDNRDGIFKIGMPADAVFSAEEE